MVRGIAAAIYQSGSPHGVDYRDLVQMGVVGLLQSISKFDPERGISFKSFANKRIRGEMLKGLDQNSELHAQNVLRRSIRRDRAESLHEQSAADSSGDEFAQMIEVAIGVAIGHMLEGTAMLPQQGNANLAGERPSEFLGICESLRGLVDELPEPDDLIIRFHYFEGLPFAEIAELLGLSKGRISQRHARALRILRERQRGKGKLSLEA
jgi:RNA polymerase sigma factor for flagellar operon FliA